MKTHRNFLTDLFQRNFPAGGQRNFLEPYAVNVVKNFIIGVDSLAKKPKEIEQDARKKFCNYPSA